MNCPRCGGKNQENTKVCSDCGLKLKVTCPKCKGLNIIGREKCFRCGFRLILICPKCKTPNRPNAQNCRKCNFELLRVCPNCNTLNYVRELNCIKCSKAFASANYKNSESLTKPEQSSVNRHQDLGDSIFLSIELINFENIRKYLDSDDLTLKFQKEFQQIIVNEAKKNAKAVKKVSNQVIAIEFKAGSAKISAIYAVVAAQRVLSDISDLNVQLQEDVGIILEAKAGISVSYQTKNSFSKLERAVASVNEIVVVADLYNLVSDMFDFEEIDISQGNGLLTFYKLRDDSESINDSSINIEDPEITSTEELQDTAQEDIQNKEKIEKQRNEVLQARDKLRKTSQIFEQFGEKEVSQEEAYNIAAGIITKEKKGAIVGIAGLDGIGKSTVVSSIRQSLLNEKIIWLMGMCQPVNQLVPFAFFQDSLKTLFNLPMFTLNIAESKKFLSHSLETLEIKDKHIENILCKLLFQENLTSDLSGLFDNQLEIYESIRAIFSALNKKDKVVLLIEDLEFIDIASIGCIKYLIDNFFLDNGNQIIATYSPEVNLNDYFLSSSYNDRIIKLHLTKMTDEDMDKALLGMLNNQDIIPVELKKQIFSKAKGFPIYIEQALWYLFQVKAIFPEDNLLKFDPQAENMQLPENIEAILNARLAQINTLNSNNLKIMLSVSLFGQRSMSSIIQLMLGIEAQQFNNLMQMLLSNGIFVNFDNYSIMFKHKFIWNIVYKLWHSNEEKVDYHNQALESLTKYTRVSGSILAVQAELANFPEKAVEYWGRSAVEAISVGDVQVYVATQKQTVGLLDKINLSDDSEKERIKNHIYEQIGKVSYEVNPLEAVDYLSNAIVEREKKGDTIQVIELTGYLAKSCEILGNYTGVIECVDRALSGIDEQKFHIESALLYYSKLDALYNLGKLEETAVIAKSKVISVLRSFIETNNVIPGLGDQDLNYIEIDAELTLAKALAVQGNKESINVVGSVINKASKLGFVDIEFKARIIEALYRILQGRTKSASNSLAYLTEIIPQIKDKTLIRLYWDFVTALSKIFNGNYSQAGKLCYSLQILAEECREYNVLAIIKLLLAKTLKETGNIDSAKTIYNEIITYCSEYKIATGALLGWYLIAEIELTDGNILAAHEIAQRAHDISQKAEINNYFFTALLKGLIAEVHIVKGNFESARMYVEQALELAKSMELYIVQAELYLTYGKIFRKIVELSESAENKWKNADNAYKLYMSALDIVKMIENDYMISKVERELQNLIEFCELSSIKI
ncbi:MAG: hypothetical protein A2104_08645 [Candidatus Melainabacteria bacterium GWF2_32_7]|nr:MAG: hypothetical protein A2104_08645 [Candidatus Melainabacteria bacterium GWF2_32_7]